MQGPGPAGLTGGEKEEAEKAKQAMQIDQGEDGEDGGNYKAQNQFHTHLKKQEVRDGRSLLLSLCLCLGLCQHLVRKPLAGSHVICCRN